jgi:hypothetical protein
MPEQLENDEIADALHDAVLRELGRLVPTGSGRTASISAVCDGLTTVMAEFLVASQPNMPADAEEIERLAALLRTRLQEAIAERRARVVGGHA